MFTKKIETEIELNASAEQVWKALMAFEKYPEWNSFIVQIVGEAKLSKRLNIEIAPPGGNKMKFAPQVISFEKNRLFEWKGQLGMPGIFDGKHRFEIVSINDSICKLKHSEQFSGILVPLISLEKTEKGFQKMNQEFKNYLETK